MGFEALARWVSPTGEVKGPAAFLSKINELGLQADFTQTILEAALLEARRWQGFGLPIGVAVNLEEEMLAARIGVEILTWVLDKFPDLEGRITLEITEDVFVARSLEAIKDALQVLQESGVRISMDDFGTGYGSFRHLQEMPFDELKIDRAFTKGIGRDRSSEVIIESFLAVASGLGASVVAEGVETPEQRAFLVTRGCAIGQGYLFGKPMTAADTLAFVEAARGLQRGRAG